MAYAKILIEGSIELISGMHIGTSKEYSAIGAVDSPVVLDTLTKLPMIPGSSLKGKIRSLLYKKYNNGINVEKEDIKISRLFGTAGSEIRPSRVIFSDIIMSQSEKNRLLDEGAEKVTEVKFENTINKLTGMSNPRQIERVIRGSIFDMNVIYEMTSDAELVEDIKLLLEGFKLLEYDYLGGSGSRGYGRVKIKNLTYKVVIGEVNSKPNSDIKELFDKNV